MHNKTDTSIYIHWPFCALKCPYCDFNSHVREKIDHIAWKNQLIKEIDYWHDYLSSKSIRTIFFGGGTPSLAHPSVIGGILEHLSSKYSIDPNIEISMEANPTSIECDNFRNLSESGVNRISIGIQSFDENALKFLGRNHSSTDAINAIEIAKKFFSRYSFDLIYAIPNQTVNNWINQLDDAIKLADGHISLYQLTIEKGTKFFDLYKNKAFILPDDNLSADLYIATEDVITQHGYYAYEVSNYSKKGLECKHNMQYWHLGDYVGIGPGAHGRVTIDNAKFATKNISSPEQWFKSVQIKGAGLQQYIEMTEEECIKELIIMGMRVGTFIPENMREKAKFLAENGLLINTDGNVYKPTLKGRLVLNSIVEYLL